MEKQEPEKLPRKEPKNIIVCCDGTGNEFGDDNSNVVKLCTTLIINDNQVSYYHPGVGTMGSPNAQGWFQKQWSIVRGLAFGYGITSNISDAYRYLMETYEEGDRIFLFGFSRGAYTARALGGMLQMYGLLHRGNEGLIPYITKKFASHTRAARGMAHTFQVAEGFKRTFSRDILLHFVGVWDTVSSVGWVSAPVVIPYTACNPIMKVGRHAVSIDERRCFFRDNLWGKPFLPGDPAFRVEQNIKQVWFAGVHSDVGGSYPEGQSGLSKITLEWMLREATSFGLLIDEEKAKQVLGIAVPAPFLPPCASDGHHESLKGPWWLLEFLPHYKYDKRKRKPHWTWPPFGTHRHLPANIVVHESVVERLKTVEAYRPKNLPDNFAIEPRVPLFSVPQDSHQPGEERYQDLSTGEKVQAILDFKIDANPLLENPPDTSPDFPLLTGLLLVAGTMLIPPSWKQWYLAVTGIVLLKVVQVGIRKLYRLGLDRHHLQHENKQDDVVSPSRPDQPPTYLHPWWKAANELAATVLAAAFIRYADHCGFERLAAAVAALLVLVGLLSAMATIANSRAYNALLSAWKEASNRPEFLQYSQTMTRRGQPIGPGATGGSNGY